MKFFFFKRKTNANINTTFARARLSRSMPGETGSMASVRFGGMSL